MNLFLFATWRLLDEFYFYILKNDFDYVIFFAAYCFMFSEYKLMWLFKTSWQLFEISCKSFHCLILSAVSHWWLMHEHKYILLILVARAITPSYVFLIIDSLQTRNNPYTLAGKKSSNIYSKLFYYPALINLGHPTLYIDANRRFTYPSTEKAQLTA